MSERWRSIEGWPAYEVSDLGNVRRCVPVAWGKQWPPGHVLKPKINGRGRRNVSFCRDGTITTREIAPLVCAAFHGPKPTPELVCAHGDGRCTNDVWWNLRWATQAENMADAFDHGTIQRANPRKSRARNPNGRSKKLTIADAREIRALAASLPKKQIARQFKIDPATVRQIVSGKIWRSAMPPSR